MAFTESSSSQKAENFYGRAASCSGTGFRLLGLQTVLNSLLVSTQFKTMALIKEICMTHPLNHITVATPCSADWEAMQGNGQVRFCQQCQLNVYNLSGMAQQEATALVLSQEGHLCVRFYQRPDGTVLTQDCPVGLQALYRRKITRWGTTAAALSVITLLGSFYVGGYAQTQTSPTHTTAAMPVRMGEPTLEKAIMGDMISPKKGQTNPDPAIQGNLVMPTPQPAPIKKPCKPPKKQPPKADLPDSTSPPQVIMGKMMAPKPLAPSPSILPEAKSGNP
jgi:hypothetical protein